MLQFELDTGRLFATNCSPKPPHVAVQERQDRCGVFRRSPIEELRIGDRSKKRINLRSEGLGN